MNWKEKLANNNWPQTYFIPPPHCPASIWQEQCLPLFPSLATSLKNTPQDPVYHAEGDVWTHTEMVVQSLLSHPAYANLDPQRQGVVFYAALLHDISKPSTTQTQENGKIIAPGHSRKGAIEVRRLLWEGTVPFDLREMVCRLIETHQTPFFALSDKAGLGVDYIARKLSMDRDMKLLCLLAEADIQGRICKDQNQILDDIALFAQACIENHCYENAYAFPDEATKMAYFQSRGARYAQQAVYVEAPFEVIMLSGLPASGKNTWLSKTELPVVSYDDTREELGFKHGHGTGAIVHAVDDKMRNFLRRREPFVINATNLSEQMRQKNLGLLGKYGAHVRIIYLEQPREIILERNRKRNSSLSNEKLLRMTHRWEVPGLTEAHSVDYYINLPAPSCRPRLA